MGIMCTIRRDNTHITGISEEEKKKGTTAENVPKLGREMNPHRSMWPKGSQID